MAHILMVLTSHDQLGNTGKKTGFWLEEFAAPPNGIYVVLPQRKHLPLRLRLWIEFLKRHYGQSAFWRRAPGSPWPLPGA